MRRELTRVLDLAQSLQPDELAVLLGELRNCPLNRSRSDEFVRRRHTARRADRSQGSGAAHGSVGFLSLQTCKQVPFHAANGPESFDLPRGPR